jgi:glyoxylase-like metal-dependent hydrolase (beta-lactamase superfamily II)
MNALEAALDYPWGDELPEPGGAIAVTPDLRWVRLKLPFVLNHINVWLLRDRIEDRAGWTIVDCGIDDAPTRAAWEQIFATQLDGLPVLRVVVTHMHPDHLGLAHWICERWTDANFACQLWISATDYLMARTWIAGATPMAGPTAMAFFSAHGLSNPEWLEAVEKRSGHYATLVPALPPTFNRLVDGGKLTIGERAWTCYAGQGHAPEHICLYDDAAKILISGDMVLPRISTNVSVTPLQPNDDALGLYLASLRRLNPLPAQTLVLPSHGRPFRGLQTRIDQLQTHHADRLADLRAACAVRAVTAYDMLPALFSRALDMQQTFFAMGEAVAHLNLLWHQGALARFIDEDHVFRFTARPAS